MRDELLKFYEENKEIRQENSGTYKIMIADDEEEVHKVTKMILKNFVFENKTLEFIDVYSGQEAKEALESHEDIALVFLDVVMETEHAGLEVVKYLREDIKNLSARVVLRTGQPGEAPEEDIIRMYDINDYRLKTELTVKRLNTTLYTALRNYRDLKTLENHKKSLEKIIQASAHLFEHNSLNEFLDTILKELSGFCYASTDIMYIRENEKKLENGLVLLEQTGDYKIIAGTGSFKSFVNCNLKDVTRLDALKKWIEKPMNL
jgi:CheY-like chemotaxis protein